MTEKPYKISIENIFEGPMDLLVYLIQKNEVEIKDIPIASITDQFIAYLEMMKYLNIDIAGEFLVMAATLALVKSRMMLPLPHREGEDAEDPRMEIIRPLMEYIALKASASMLSERDILGEDTFSRKPSPDEIPKKSDCSEEFVEIGLLELYDAFSKILENSVSAHVVDMSDESLSINEKVEEIMDLLAEKNELFFHDLFSGLSTKVEIIITFLAVLEMVKRSFASIFQHLQDGFIHIRKAEV
ncbi:segregation and condensation protein A [Desulforegula conservatrix]|uniref:segregation and condensation protein A n=1 Tax=Desulforegula conservatrix TaxID=153026 RepID=UPI0004016441|nr:segregation/condensation protein A [Desulforegula conservatrix]